MSIVIPAGLYHSGGDIETLQDDLGEIGGIIDIPAGIHGGTEFTIRAGNITFRGEGMFASTLTINSLTGNRSVICRSVAGFRRSNITFEDLCFDGAAGGLESVNQCVNLNGLNVFEVTFRRCRFRNFSGWGILAGLGIIHLTVEDCLGENAGNNVGKLVQVSQGAQHIRVWRNRTRWVGTVLTVDTNQPGDRRIASSIRYQDNESEGGWYLQKAVLIGEGESVSYTDNRLTDTSANFMTSLAQAGSSDKIRIMPILANGTLETENTTSLQDSAGSFITDGIMQGDIIRADGKWAVVIEAVTETSISHEGWNDETSFEPTHQPPPNRNYTVYRTLIGETFQILSDTELQTRRWHDLRGNTVSAADIPAGTRYEYLGTIGTMALNVEYGAKNVMVLGNRTQRHYGDQFAVRADDSMILGNFIEQGQDMGITAWGERNIYAANRILRQGTRGIISFTNDSLIHLNLVSDSQAEQFTNDHLGDIAVKGRELGETPQVVVGNRNSIDNNLTLRTEEKIGGTETYGLVVHGGDLVEGERGPGADENVIRNNISRNHDHEVLIDSSTGDVNNLIGPEDQGNILDGESPILRRN